MEDIIKIVKSLEDSGLLLKGVTDTVQNKVKEQKKKKEDFLREGYTVKFFFQGIS